MQHKYTKSEMQQTGVYRITNIVTGTVYIGSTSTSFGRRLQSHTFTLSRRKHRNIHPQAKLNWQLVNEIREKWCTDRKSVV